ncbi:hypothetical protein [Pelagibius sp. Alg239-R121]|uniref:hypothetical protein n=1 Tax=Pelagibius sp. Alg239-R121 TaxID=2993448 RepID=UPI0024A74742|nr:hypothetical protein [Pelagibius sp. Alg239-R121]
MTEEAISNLDPALPLTLFPVRLEARYNATHLLVRIFPDVIHADGHRRGLNEHEVTIGKQYWTSLWNQTDAAVISEARRWLGAQTDPHRALWVSTATRPRNLGTRDQKPVFPKLTVDNETEPVFARMLPDEWMLRLYDTDMTLVRTQFSKAVRPDLPMAPTLSGNMKDSKHPKTGDPLSAPESFLYSQELLWTIDFDLAELIGMGLRIPLANVPDPVGALVVLGVRAERDPIAEGNALDDLLTAQWYTRGLDLVPQGTPTNNSDAGRSQVSLSDPDLEELFERETSERELPPIGRAGLISLNPALMYRLPCADSASLALGRVRTGALDRTAHAEWGEGAAAWAMNVALGYAIFGRYLSGPFGKLDGAAATSEFTGNFRDWYVDWVRGAGPLPVLRVGEQPYGLLPITSRPAARYLALDFADNFEHQLTQFLEVWKASLPVPALDPDATDGRPAESSQSDVLVVGEVLGAVPHPIAFKLRGATNQLPDDMARFDELIVELEQLIETDKFNADNNLRNPQTSLIYEDWWNNKKRYVTGLPGEDPPVPVPGIGTQIANIGFYRDQTLIFQPRAEYPSVGLTIVQLIEDDILPLLEQHRDTPANFPEAIDDWLGRPGLGSNQNVRLTRTIYEESTEDIAELVVSNAGDAAEVRTFIADVIANLDDAVQNNKAPDERDTLVGPASPLLWQLIDITCRTVPIDEIGPVRAGLLVLKLMIDHPTVADPIGELERLTRETLGLAMYRLDAWVTSRAAERLAKKRQLKAGAQIGGYGWLLDLKRSDNPTSQGFIHAPSLTHAATAAVLRSGWSAYGTESGETPLSVDLSSGRVRGGQWILDGVRNGQDLAELLGARFECYLHDRERDVWIETVRRKALEVMGSARPANAVVDGLLVARAASDMDQTDRETNLWQALEQELAAAKDADEEQDVREALEAIAADLDSVADLILTQSVHAILQGNADAAAATIAVAGGGDGAVPPVTVTETQRDGRLISHRVVAMWPAQSNDKATSASGEPIPSPLRLAEPRLFDWLELQLPKPQQVIADVTVRDSDGEIVRADTMTLEALELTICEAALLAGTRAEQDRSRLGRMLAAAAVGTAGEDESVEVDFTAPASLEDGVFSVNEFGLIAAALIDALGRSRALQSDDLVLPGADPGPPLVDRGELETRVSGVEEMLVDMMNDLSQSGANLRTAALQRAGVIKVAGAVTVLESGVDDESVGPVIGALKKRLKRGDLPADPVDALIERLRRLTGAVVPILPVFVLPADPDRATSARSSMRARQVTADGHRWLRQVSRVRRDLGPMINWLLLSETTLGGPASRFGLAQVPETGGPWAAVDEPNGQGNRLSLFSLTGPETLALDGEPVAGLLIDSWTEAIPRRDQQTGIAVHFDAPTARPPQTVLISVVEDDPGFDADEIVDQLLHTIEQAKSRALAPGRIGDLGHYLPAVFLPPNVGA